MQGGSEFRAVCLSDSPEEIFTQPNATEFRRIAVLQQRLHNSATPHHQCKSWQQKATHPMHTTIKQIGGWMVNICQECSAMAENLGSGSTCCLESWPSFKGLFSFCLLWNMVEDYHLLTKLIPQWECPSCSQSTCDKFFLCSSSLSLPPSSPPFPLPSSHLPHPPSSYSQVNPVEKTVILGN